METILWIEKYLTVAEESMSDGRVEEGVNILKRLLFEEPGYGPLHNDLGWTYMYHANDPAQAEMHFRMAIRFDADYAPPYLHMGTLLNRGGRHAEAIEYFRAGLAKPEAIRTALLEGMGHAYEMQGEYRPAIRAYREAATASVEDLEVDRMLKGVKRCRRKRLALLFSFW
jgi:tetratricopeptide (TPR) repeat protein